MKFIDASRNRYVALALDELPMKMHSVFVGINPCSVFAALDWFSHLFATNEPQRTSSDESDEGNNYRFCLALHFEACLWMC